MPTPILVVNASPKRKMPTHTAVTGSIAPNTEVSVEPMLYCSDQCKIGNDGRD